MSLGSRPCLPHSSSSWSYSSWPKWRWSTWQRRSSTGRMAHGQRCPAHSHPSPVRSRRPIPAQCGGSTAGRPLYNSRAHRAGPMVPATRWFRRERHAHERRCWQRQPDRRNQSLKITSTGTYEDEVEAGLRTEALEGGQVLHPFEPGLHHRGEQGELGPGYTEVKRESWCHGDLGVAGSRVHRR